MPMEVLFRDGRISVIDGFKVFLVKRGYTGVQSDTADFTQSYSSGRLYIWDVVRTEGSSCVEASRVDRDAPSEETLVDADFVSQVEGQQLNVEYSEEAAVEPVTAAVQESSANCSYSADSPDSSPKFQKNKIIRSENLDNYFPTYKSMRPNSNVLDADETVQQSDAVCSMCGGIGRFSRQQISSDFAPSLSDSTKRDIKALSANEQEDHSECREEFQSAQTEEIRELEDATLHISNRTAVHHGEDTTVASPSRRTNVYSSCLKISLNSSKVAESVSVKATQQHVTPSSDSETVGAVERGEDDASTGRQNSSESVREEITPDMKVYENQSTVQSEAPQHSAVDEGDFAGVVDGPTKNVKEIRAMFKGPDYVNYAKPKVLAKKPPAPSAKPMMHPTSDPNCNSAEVAQQVIGLFKGALTLDDDATATSSPQPAPAQDGVETGPPEPQASVKDKVASFNNRILPAKEQEINNNEEVIVAAHLKAEESAPCVEIITNDHSKTSSVKHEKVLAESYDESLDQFYDVLEELTAS